MVRQACQIAIGAALSAASIALVVDKARQDSADPARCGVLVAAADRCCAPGQQVSRGTCVGRPTECPSPLTISDDARGCVANSVRVAIGGGMLHLGPMDWEAHGHVRAHDVHVASFALDSVEATEAQYANCVLAAACSALPLSGEPGRAVSGVTRDQAVAYCSFRGGRLPTDDEWTWAAGGTKTRRYPWGDTGAVCRRGAWGLRDGPCGYGGTGPEIAGAHPDGRSPEGVFDLSGNVAEWVMGDDGSGARVRGGSWATSFAAELRSWHARAVAPSELSMEIGVRCAYDVDGGPG